MAVVLRQGYANDRLIFVAAATLKLLTTSAFALAQNKSFTDGMHHYEPHDFVEAPNVWHPISDAGNAKAAYNIGKLYFGGKGVEGDPTLALEFWRKAAEAENVDSQHNLALTLISCDADDRKYQKALHWLLRAAENSSPHYFCTLGKMYLYGFGALRNFQSAYKLIGRAGENGVSAALYNVGKMTRDGIGTEPDAEVTFKLYKRAVEGRHARAQAALAIGNAQGDGSPPSKEQALYWAHRAYKTAQNKPLKRWTTCLRFWTTKSQKPSRRKQK